jgi:hypothetical protein
VNPARAHVVANVLCEDTPDPEVGRNELGVAEWLTTMIFWRNPEELRQQGLHAILHEFEVQVFAY